MRLIAPPYGGVMRRIVVATLVAFAALSAPAAAAELPVLHINSPRAIPDEPKVAARLRMPGYRGRIGIERRGQSSQQFPKRSYAVELARDAALLGMPADDDWVLYAPYNDKTLMRNVVAYATARGIGRYAARTRFVELRLNGRYRGVYVLMERLELGAERVAGEALYEFTFPFQARLKDPSFRTPVLGRPIVWEDPERADLTPRRSTSPSSTSCSKTRTPSTPAPTWRSVPTAGCGSGRSGTSTSRWATRTTGRVAACVAGCSRSATGPSASTATGGSAVRWRAAGASS